MKTYTKKTEEQYLEYLNGYTQVLKQEYADRILAELKEQGLVCECVRGETKETGNYYHNTRLSMDPNEKIVLKHGEYLFDIVK